MNMDTRKNSTLWINGHTWPITADTDLAPLYDTLQSNEMLEISLQRCANTNMMALVNADRGLLVHNRVEPWESWSSRDPLLRESHEVATAFKLHNGQVDEFPIGWTLPRNSIAAYLELFWKTGKRLNAESWHQD